MNTPLTPATDTLAVSEAAIRPALRPDPRPAPERASVTVAFGDGIGPEIMAASLRILEAAGARLDINRVDIGREVYLKGNTAGIGSEAWDSLQRTKVFYKAPITTPQGGGYKSLNVTVRKTLGLFANVRPSTAYAPFVSTRHPGMDVVIVRENEEDLYAGIEHRQTEDVYQCLKLISRPGTEKIVRFAFEYARAHGRHKVTCFTKDNIMKLTDGLFHRTFDEIGADYPDIEKEHLIVDIGAALLADRPERFDVVVAPNLYGDIVSDIAAQITGSVGLGPSANIGEGCAMFEAVHGSAPDIAGKNIANPSGLLLAGVMMLLHIGQTEAAARVHNAWLRTVEDGIHTADIFREGLSRQSVGTTAFADAVVERLGELPRKLAPVSYAPGAGTFTLPRATTQPVARREMVGIDVFVCSRRKPGDVAADMREASAEPFELTMVTNRGVKVWPDGNPATFCTDHWRCRFIAQGGTGLPEAVALLGSLARHGIDVIKTEHLYTFDGEPGYSLGQGQ